MNAIKGGQSRPRDVPKWQPKRVGILGAGMMGSGIAFAQTTRGIATVLKDVSVAAAEKGKDYTARVTQEAEPLQAADGFFASNTSPCPSPAWHRPTRGRRRSSVSISSAPWTR